MRYVEMIKHCKPPIYAGGLLDDTDIKLLKREGFKLLKTNGIYINKSKATNKNGIRVV